MPSDILEASRPKAKVQCRVTGLSPMKTSKDKSYLDGVHIDARIIHRAVHPRLYEFALSSHVANVNNSAVAACAVENKSVPHTIINIPKRDGHTYIHTDAKCDATED